MANNNAPFGLKPLAPFGQTGFITHDYYVDSGSVSTSLYQGDPVIIAGNSNTDYYNNGELMVPGSKPTVTRASAGSNNYITGIIQGFNPIPTNLSTAGATYYTQGTGSRIARVIDNIQPGQEFIIQDDGVATLTTSAVGQNANIIFGSTSSQYNPISSAMLSTASVGTSNAYQLQIVRAFEMPNNQVGSPYCIWVVRINLAQSNAPATGV